MGSKKNFEDAMNHIRDLGDTDLQLHFRLIVKNATYMSHFSVDETKLWQNSYAAIY